MKYKKYKGFLPEYIRVNQNNKIERSNTRAIILLSILNMIIFPLNLDKLFVKNDIEVDKSITYEKSISKYQIIKWIDIGSVLSDKITVYNDEGELKLKNRDSAYNIEDYGFVIQEFKIIDDEVIVNIKGR